MQFVYIFLRDFQIAQLNLHRSPATIHQFKNHINFKAFFIPIICDSIRATHRFEIHAQITNHQCFKQISY